MPELDLNLLLAYTCSNPRKEGYSEYEIDLCCFKVLVLAKKVEDGEMNQETGQWIKTPKYDIKSYSIQ